MNPQTLFRKVFRFLARHRWSVPLAALSTGFFVELALEVREGELDAFDAAVTGWVVQQRGSFDGLMLFLTHLGTGRSLTVITVAVMALLLLLKRRREATFLVFACGGAGLLNIGLKLLFHRARPDATVEYLVQAPASFSFPSGHAMGSMAVFASLVVVLQVVRMARALQVGAAIVAFLLATSIGLSRIYLGVHYPSDVLGGQLAAAAWVSAMTGWFYPRLLPGEESRE